MQCLLLTPTIIQYGCCGLHHTSFTFTFTSHDLFQVPNLGWVELGSQANVSKPQWGNRPMPAEPAGKLGSHFYMNNLVDIFSEMWSLQLKLIHNTSLDDRLDIFYSSTRSWLLLLLLLLLWYVQVQNAVSFKMPILSLYNKQLLCSSYWQNCTLKTFVDSYKLKHTFLIQNFIMMLLNKWFILHIMSC